MLNTELEMIEHKLFQLQEIFLLEILYWQWKLLVKFMT